MTKTDFPPTPDLRPHAAAMPRPWRARLADAAESVGVQRAITALIVLNAVILGLETSPSAMAAAGPWLAWLDFAILLVFVAELASKMVGRGLAFFRNGWNLFDLAVVGIALAPASGALSVLRALRILRVLRLVSVVPSLRRVVASLVSAIPGLGAISGVLLLFFYVSAVLATKLYGGTTPELFGSIGGSMFTLFQIMTLEGWADIVREIMEPQPLAWLFFIPFILVATFTMLNLFIAIIVNAMQSEHEAEQRAEMAAIEKASQEETATIGAQIAGLGGELGKMRGELADMRREMKALLAKA
ncbi:MAG TPA: ion transporter [Alphaproteobacteria bacterium]|jgi:voltage-gated sodium channel